MAAVGCRWPPWSVGCMVYLFLPRYIVCHDVVSAVQKILSSGTKKPLRPAFYPNKPVPKKMIISIFMKKTLQPKMLKV